MARRKSDSPQKAALREMMNNYLVENVHTVLHPVFQMGIMEEGGYEIISGHRRKHAAERSGLFKVPVLIRDLSDEDAVDIMIYSNIQRTNILPSEKAFAYRLQMETMRHQGKKADKTEP